MVTDTHRHTHRPYEQFNVQPHVLLKMTEQDQTVQSSSPPSCQSNGKTSGKATFRSIKINPGLNAVL